MFNKLVKQAEEYMSNYPVIFSSAEETESKIQIVLRSSNKYQRVVITYDKVYRTDYPYMVCNTGLCNLCATATDAFEDAISKLYL